MEFIYGTYTVESAANVLKNATEVALAVAFWGGDAVARLDFAKTGDVRIVCNATSGACNPKTLEALMDRFGPRLRTNPKLHAKVYWTPNKTLITSANASASGLSLEDEEVEANIEAGILITKEENPEIIDAVKRWFDKVYNSDDTKEVDNKVLKRAKESWDRRRPGRSTQLGNVTVIKALNDRATLRDRDIWVVNYEEGELSPKAGKQFETLTEHWESGEEQPPAVERVQFSGVELFEENERTLREYHWNSWLIDLTEPEARFWRVPDKTRISEFLTVPIYETRKLPFGTDGWMTITRQDMAELRTRWSSRIGARSDKWVPLKDFADQPPTSSDAR
jgi:hypothetical protein